MITFLKNKFTPENIVIILFVAMFWSSIMEHNRWSKGVIIIAVLFGAYVLFAYKAAVLKYFYKSGFLLLFLLFWVPLLLSTFDSSALKFSIRADLNMLRFFFVGVLAIYLTQSSLKKVYYLLLFFIIVISIDAVIEWITGYHLLGVSRDRNRIMGLFGYYHLGYYLATILPILLCQLLESTQYKQRYRYILGGVLICAFLSIFVAGSRAGWISAFVAVVLSVSWIIIHKGISLKKFSLMGLTIVIMLVAVSQISIIEERFINPNGSASLKVGSYEWLDKFSSNRLVLWEFSWNQYLDNPVLGDGAGSFRPLFSAQPAEFKNGHTIAYFPHLQGLEVLAETGSIGFVLYIFILVWLLRLIFISKYFPAWFMIAFLAIMPINTHVALYGSFWGVLIWIPLILGLRERYLLMQKDPANA